MLDLKGTERVTLPSLQVKKFEPRPFVQHSTEESPFYEQTRKYQSVIEIETLDGHM
jgi:hypothetical protein